MKILVIIALLLLGVVGVAAQMGPDEPVAKPPERQYDDGRCYELQVKMLTAATYESDDSAVLLDMHKADAYARLDALGQKC